MIYTCISHSTIERRSAKLNFIKAITTAKHHKKGFSLVEVLIAAALASLLICWEIPIGLRYISKFDENVTESRDFIYVNQAFDFIEGAIMDGKAAAVSNNIIEVVRWDGAGSDWIRRDASGNIVVSYHQCYYSTINNIMKNAAAFTAVKTGKAVLLTITTRKGRTYKKCIYINMEKAEMDIYWYILL